MPSVSPSGGGGSVSAPLTLTAPNDLNPILTLVAAAGTIADGNAVFVLKDENGANQIYIDPDFIQVTAPVGAGAQSLVVAQRDTGGGSVTLSSQQGLSVTKGAFRLVEPGVTTGGIGLMVDGPYTAPADDVFSGAQWTIWLDRTAGAPSLRIKATDINGNPFTATIPLT